MNTTLEHRLRNVKPKRKLAVTLAVSAPVIFWFISLFSCFGSGKEKDHVQ